MNKYSRDQVYTETLKYFDGDEIATNVFIDKYCLTDSNGGYLELNPEQMHERMAAEFARIEDKFGGPSKLSYETILYWLREFKFIVPQGSIMFGLGNNHSLNSLSNCTVIEGPEDSISSIMDVGRDIANLAKMRCGIGFDISKLRPDGFAVNNSARTSTGAWSFVKFYAELINTIGQKARRGAGMITLDITHPDSLLFISCKKDISNSTAVNISLKAYDNFMEAVDNDEEFVLKWEGPSGVDERVVRAVDIWNEIIKSATHTAEPGLLYWDRHLKYNPSTPYEELRIHSTNPCVTGDTLVTVWEDNGSLKEVPIRDLVGQKELRVAVDDRDLLHNDYIDLNMLINNHTAVDQAEAVIHTGKRPIYKLQIEGAHSSTAKKNGDSYTSLHLTGDHKVRTPRGMVPAQDLEPGDKVHVIGGGTAKVTHCTPRGGQEDVYDVVNTTTHTFIANGVVVSNCGEQALENGGACRLTSCNLKHLVLNKFTDEASVDFKKLKEMYSVATRLSDDLVELELEKITTIMNKAKAENDLSVYNLWEKFYKKGVMGRRVGIGLHGLGDFLASLCVRYDSDEALRVVEEVMASVRDSVYSTSCELAVERGSFELFDWEKEKDNEFIASLPSKLRNKIKKSGRRNVCLLTCAPTGSVSILSRCSSGIEPIFANSYTRKRKVNRNSSVNKEGLFVSADGQMFEEYEVAHHLVSEWLERNDGKKLPDYFVEAHAIDWNKRVRMQGVLQKYIDNSISSTINLPKGTSEETVGSIYLEAWRRGLKGITVYVEGSREGILNTSKDADGEVFEYYSAVKRPMSLKCDIHHTQVQGKKWVVFVGLMEGKPYEIFAGLSKYVELPKKYNCGIIKKRHYKTKPSEYDLIINEGEEDEIKIKNIVESFENDSHGL